MKNTYKILVFTFTVLLLINFSLESLKKKKKHNLKKEKKSKVVNNVLNDPIVMENSGYRSPIIVERLSMGRDPEYFQSAPFDAEIVNTGDVYYNGKEHLNAKIIECNSLTIPTECMASALCGWCGHSNSCIPGTPKGPLTKCSGKFAFTKADQLNAFNAGTINLNVRKQNGDPALIKTDTPDMSSIILNPMMQ